MVEFNYSRDEVAIIEDCIEKGHKSWGEKRLGDLKTRLKNHLKQRQLFFCCYCMRSLHDEFNLVIDIEHILPKHAYVKFMFTLDNLAASCKRCNMKMKGRKVDFINSCFNADSNPFFSENYKFIHPNSDVFKNHIRYEHHQVDTDIMVTYSVKNNSSKGHFSMEFFQLERLARNSFDRAQGLTFEDEDYFEGNPDNDDDDDDDDGTPSSYVENIACSIEKLALQHGQL